MSRTWPPRSHRYPTVFKPGDDASGLLKQVTPTLSQHFADLLARGTFFETHHCFDFDASFYFPNRVIAGPDRKVDSVIVMINGLNEIHNYHFNHYDRFGISFARRGLGAALHPSPFHLNRTPFLRQDRRAEYESRDKPKQRWPRAPGTKDMKRHPSNSLLRSAESLFFCFEQTALELRSFAASLKREVPHETRDQRSFFEHHVHRNARVSLLGYSMGGLQALYTFMSYPGLFDRCILINSGVSIDQLNPKPVGISKCDWDKMAADARGQFSRVEGRLSNPQLLHEILFGFSVKAKAFDDLAANILFVSGGADDVADSKYLEKLPAALGLNVLHIHGLGHPLESPIFDRWFPVITEAIINFVATTERDMLSAKELLAALAEFRIEGQRWDEFVRGSGSIQESPYVDGPDLRLEDIVDRVVTGDEFVRCLMMAKRYYSTDAELLRALERERGTGRVGALPMAHTEGRLPSLDAASGGKPG